MKILQKYRDHLLLLALILLVFWPLVSGDGVMKWDAMDLYLPWKFFITDAITHGQLPFWNPFINGGFAQMGDPGTWYPVSYLFRLFGPYGIGHVSAEYLTHLYIAGIGFYALGKHLQLSRSTCLIVACAYMFSGLCVGNAQHLTWVVSASWFPWVFCGFRKLLHRPNMGTSIRLSLTLFLMLSGGYPPFFFVTAYLLLFYFMIHLIRRKRRKQPLLQQKTILYFIGSGLIFTLLSSVILAASFDLSEHITRGEGLGEQGTWRLLSGSFPLKGVVSFLFPLATGHPNFSFWHADFSMINAYFGGLLLLILIFSAFQKECSTYILPSMGVGMLFLTIAMGEVFPFRKWLAHLPLWDLFRFPSLFRLFAIFFFLIATGHALDFVWKCKNLQGRLSRFLMFATGALVIVAIIVFSRMERWKFLQLLQMGWHHFLSMAHGSELLFLQCAVLIALLIAFAMLVRLRPEQWSRWLTLVILLEICSATIMQRFTTVIESKTIAEASVGMETLPEEYPTPALNAPQRMSSDGAIHGEFTYLWRNLSILRKMPSLEGYSPYAFRTTAASVHSGEYAKFDNFPLAFLVHAAIHNESLPEKQIDSLSHEKIHFSLFSPNRMVFRTNLEHDATFVLAQNNYPHWRAFIDDESAQIHTVSQTFIGIHLPKGNHLVRFEFQPKKVRICFWVSCMTALFTTIFLLIWTFRTHRRTSKVGNHP